MENPNPKNNWQYVRELLATPWRFVSVYILGLITIFEIIKTELLSVETRERYQLFTLLPDWPWEYWLLLTALVSIILVFHSAIRALRHRDADIATLADERSVDPSLISHDMPIRDALIFMTGYDPGNDFGDAVHYTAADEVTEAALREQITVWGRQILHTAIAPRSTMIDPRYWEEKTLNPATIFSTNERLPHTKSRTARNPGQFDYAQVQVNHQQLKKLSKAKLPARLKEYYQEGWNFLPETPRSNESRERIEAGDKPAVERWCEKVEALLRNHDMPKAHKNFSSFNMTELIAVRRRLGALKETLTNELDVWIKRGAQDKDA